MFEVVPRTRHLKDIYYSEDITSQTERWDILFAKFSELYGHPATFVARSPGRVNIIGEHIDYNLYEVLPMAITSDMLLAVSATPLETPEFTINIANVDLKYPTTTFSVPATGEITFDSSVHHWANYFKAGLSGALQRLSKEPGFRPMNMNVVVDGSIPPAAGLSSSGAFVVASSLAVLVANAINPVNKIELTEMAIASERAIGLNGGGMDQTASIFGVQGSAIHVSFFPNLSAEPVQFPKTDPAFCFVIAQTFVEAVKHTTAPIHYNLRAVECSLAATVLFHMTELQIPLSKDGKPQRVTLREFQSAYFEAKSGLNTPEQLRMLNQIEEILILTKKRLEKEEGYSREDICSLLSITIEELEERFMREFPIKASRFKLRQRAIHVFSEALRVYHFMHLLQQSTSEPYSERNLGKILGQLMNQSQTSCRELYECSSQELDQLCLIAQGEGAYGSRLTGAGWGGCSVHLIAVGRINAVKKAWKKRYYAGMELSQQQKENAVVVSKPGSGSFVYAC